MRIRNLKRRRARTMSRRDDAPWTRAAAQRAPGTSSSSPASSLAASPSRLSARLQAQMDARRRDTTTTTTTSRAHERRIARAHERPRTRRPRTRRPDDHDDDDCNPAADDATSRERPITHATRIPRKRRRAAAPPRRHYPAHTHTTASTHHELVHVRHRNLHRRSRIQSSRHGPSRLRVRATTTTRRDAMRCDVCAGLLSAGGGDDRARRRKR